MALGFYSATSMQFRNFIALTIKLTTAHQQLKCRKADKATSAAGTKRTFITSTHSGLEGSHPLWRMNVASCRNSESFR